MESTLLITFDDILHWTNISGSVDSFKVMPHILNAQILYIEPILGSALYDKILDMVNDDTISGNTDYNNLLFNYITPSLVFHTMELYIPMNAFQISDAGVYQFAITNANVSPLDEIEKLSNKYRVIGAKHDQKLSDYLCKYSSLYQEFISNDGLVKKTEVSPRTGWYLGKNNIQNKIRD